jgi:hypothetical protein
MPGCRLRHRFGNLIDHYLRLAFQHGKVANVPFTGEDKAGAGARSLDWYSAGLRMATAEWRRRREQEPSMKSKTAMPASVLRSPDDARYAKF